MASYEEWFNAGFALFYRMIQRLFKIFDDSSNLGALWSGFFNTVVFRCHFGF